MYDYQLKSYAKTLPTVFPSSCYAIFPWPYLSFNSRNDKI